jgi:hypothetical protein
MSEKINVSKEDFINFSMEIENAMKKTAVRPLQRGTGERTDGQRRRGRPHLRTVGLRPEVSPAWIGVE